MVSRFKRRLLDVLCRFLEMKGFWESPRCDGVFVPICAPYRGKHSIPGMDQSIPHRKGSKICHGIFVCNPTMARLHCHADRYDVQHRTHCVRLARADDWSSPLSKLATGSPRGD
jgi:hypothetical protein